MTRGGPGPGRRPLHDALGVNVEHTDGGLLVRGWDGCRACWLMVMNSVFIFLGRLQRVA